MFSFSKMEKIMYYWRKRLQKGKPGNTKTRMLVERQIDLHRRSFFYRIENFRTLIPLQYIHTHIPLYLLWVLVEVFLTLCSSWRCSKLWAFQKLNLCFHFALILPPPFNVHNKGSTLNSTILTSTATREMLMKNDIYVTVTSVHFI